MQSIEHCDKKKVDCKVSSVSSKSKGSSSTSSNSSTSSSSSSVPSTSKTTTIANHSPSGNEKNNMSSSTNEIKLKNKCCNNSNTSPSKTVIEKYTDINQIVLDSSESDEESVSEGDLDEEIPESCSSSDDDLELDETNLGEEEESEEEDEDGDDEGRTDDDDEDCEEDEENDTVPVLRSASLALTDAAEELNRMRTDTARDRNILSRTLIAACADNDVNTVRRLLGDGTNTINEGTDDGESLLSLACSAGYYELAQVLLAMQAQVEDRGQKNDCTPLMEAASAGHVEIIKLLISHNADVNAQSSTGNTPLMYACAAGHIEAVKELLAAGANIEDHNENGHTPLMEAASAGHVEVAKILLDHGAGINTHSNEFKESALTLACYKGHLDMVRFLLEAGADQEHKTDEMHTALMEASMDGHVEVARLLLDSGAQVNMPTDSFESPLTLAACGGHVDLAMLLLERGANIEEVNDEGYTPLMEASREGHEEMAALLLSQGANINAQTEETQETALTLACCGGFLEVADYLLKNGADLEIGASTPLMEAAQEGHIELVRFLLESGANVHAQTPTGDTALTYACENGHTDVAEVLLMYGAELEHESEGGRTPLMKACRAGHICTIKFLINKGADVNKQSTSNDHTPLSLACAGGHQAVVDLLLKSCADPFHKLKDNSTMLIEASKGGHTQVVQLLLDYPNCMYQQQQQPQEQVQQAQQVPQAQQQVQQQVQQQEVQQQHQQQRHQQQQHQQIQQPTVQQPLPEIQLPSERDHSLAAQVFPDAGLQEVPEAVRVANQQIFQHQATPTDATLPNSLQNILLNSNVKNTPMEDSILANMRYLRNQGFKDGLALGLARFGLVNNNNNTSQNNNINGNDTIITAGAMSSDPPMLQQPIPLSLPVTSAVNTTPHTNNVKQKSLLRKNRQTPAPFELTAPTPIDPTQQNRLQQFGEDLSKTFGSVTAPSVTDKNVMKPNFLEEFKLLDPTKQKSPFKISDGENTPIPYVPTSYALDLNLASTNATTIASTTCSSNITNMLPNTSITTVTSSPIAPSEVSPTTAISDRPKVKSVSKKDNKNNRKAVASSISAIQTNPAFAKTELPKTNPVLQPEQLQLQLQLQQQQQQQQQQNLLAQPPCEMQQSAIQVPTFTWQKFAPKLNMDRSKATLETHPISAAGETATTTTSLTTGDQLRNNAVISEDDTTEQIAPNENILQLVAQIPNHPLQKFAQKLLVDRPKAISESHSKNASDDATPPKTNSPTTSTTPDIADISRIFFEVIRSELNANQMPEFVIHEKPCSAHTNTVDLKTNSNCEQQDSTQSKNFGDQADDLSMFSVEESDNKDVYPDIESSMDVFNTDGLQQRTRENNCNYDWTDDIDVLNVLHSVNDWPVTLQEVTANFNEYTEYANYIGLNSACKMRWTTTAPTGKVTPNEEQQQLDHQMCQIEQQLHQQLQQQFCVEQFQLLSQLQNQQQDQIPSVPLPLIDIQKQPKLDLQTIQPQFQAPTSPTSTQPMAESTGEQDQNNFQTSQSLQLLFQLPNVQQTETQSQSQAVLTTINQPNHYRYANANVVNHGVIPQNVDQQIQVKQSQLQQLQQPQQPQQQNPLPPNAHFQAIPSQNPCQQDQETSVNNNIQQPQTVQLQPQNNISTTNNTNNLCTNAQEQTCATPASQHKNKKVMEKSRRERKTIARQASAPNTNTNTALQQLGITTQSTLADKTIDIDSETDSNHDTALTLACAGGHEDLVDLLLQRDANIEHRDKKGFTPLILAATAGHEKVVNILLNNGAELEAQSERTKDTPLSLACSGGRYEVVEILLRVGANKEHRNVSDYTPLSLAASGGYVNIIRLLLNHGAEINSRTGSKLGISPLMLAAMNGHTAAVKLLLDMGSDINAQIETNRNTALTLACFQGRHEVVSLLLDRKANVEHRAKTGLTPLMEAASGGYIEVGRVLLDKGADVNATPVPSSRDTALTIAADKGHLKFVDLLLQRGAAVEVKNKKGNSPLWLAANGGHLSVVKILKNHNADIDSQDNRRVSCLMAAFRKGHTKVVEFMVNHVTQFPSDQEMTRYIATVSDKELADKCKECVKTIRAAKEAQAVKANKNASILLEELDMEKNREENRKAAAARRRERKKKKKMEKKEEKRKLLESEQLSEKESNGNGGSGSSNSNNNKKKGQSACDSKEVVSPEKEETDSGIDVHSQGSYSSAENKNNNATIDKSNENASNKSTNNKSEVGASDTNKKNQKANKNSNQSKKNKSPNRTQESDEEKDTTTTTTTTTTTKPNKQQNNNDKNHSNNDNSSENNGKNTSTYHHKEKDGKHRNATQNDSSEREPATNANHNNSSNNNRGSKDKERSNNKAENHTDSNKNETNEKNDNHSKFNSHEPVVTALHHKTSRNATASQQHHNDASDGEVSYFNSTRNKNNKTTPQHENVNKTAATKANTTHTVKRDEGWKEVSRKSSTQQHPATDTSVKKIIIPTYAISRVIGRAGSNINAIRAATGAHIEVEKQGKSQNDRMITIKGTNDATKLASSLIGSLVKDPETDILQMLPKVTSTARPIPPSNVIEKPVIQTVTQPVTSTAISSTVGPKVSKPVSIVTNSTTTTIRALHSCITTNVTNSATSSNIISSNISSTINSKTSTVTQVRNAMNAARNTVLNDTSAFKKSEPFASTKIATSTIDHSGLTALKNTIKNSTSEAFGTFAAKVAADVKPISSSESSQVYLSPKHVASNPPPPFSAANVFTNVSNTDKTVKTTSAPSYSNTINEVAVTSTVPSSIANRHDRNSVYRDVPMDKPIATVEATTIIQATAIQPLSSSDAKTLQNQRQKTTGVQLPIIPNSQSHEYSLFAGEWEKKPSAFNGRTAENYLENDTLPKADASKAPGYRGANLNSPVNSKNAKILKNDEKSTKDLDQKTSTDQSSSQKSIDFKTNESTDQLDSIPKRDVLKLETDDILRSDKLSEKDSVIAELDKPQIAPHISPIGTAPAKLPPPIGSQLNIATSQSVIKPNTSVYGNTVSDSFSQSIIRPPSMQPLSTAQDMSSSRSLSQSQLRMMVPMESMNMDTKTNQNCYDPPYRNMNYSNVDAMQSYQQGLNANQMSMSRLNPRASVFSSMGANVVKNNPTQQPYGRNNMFSQNPNQSMNTSYNPYQKMSFTNQNTGNSAPFYNRAPGRPQSQPTTNNGRMFTEFAHSSHTSPNDTFNLDHANLVMPMNSTSSMSPNGNNNSNNKNVLQSDDNRRMPRPIGTERASWKHNVNISGLNANLENVDNMNQHSLPPWLEQQPPQSQPSQSHLSNDQQPPQHWMQYPLSARNPYNDDLHLQDQYQAPMDYYNSMLPQNQPPMMPSMHYSQMAQPEIGQDLWDHEKHNQQGWSKWTN